jgi:AcrR family transcriptional regulator
VFSEMGYDAATMQAIAIRADLTRPAISYYFASKRVLYSEVVEKTNEMLTAAGRAGAEPQLPFPERLSAFFALTMHGDAPDRSAAAFMATSIFESHRHPELGGDDDNVLTTSREFLTWVVTDAIERGELTADTDVAILVELLVAVVCGMSVYGGGDVRGHDGLRTLMETLTPACQRTLDASITQRVAALLSHSPRA